MCKQIMQRACALGAFYISLMRDKNVFFDGQFDAYIPLQTKNLR